MQRSLVALFLFGVAAFALLAVLYERDPFVTVDAEVADWVAGGLPAWAELLARPFSWLGGWIGLTVLGVWTVGLLARERARVDLAFFLTASAGSQVVVALLKASFDRLRPEVGSAVPLPASAAFPSGHATAGVASFGALAVLAAERLPDRRSRVRLWTATVALGLAVGLSRVALNVHYVTDVLAGWSVGIAWLALCLLGRELVRGRLAARSADVPRV